MEMIQFFSELVVSDQHKIKNYEDGVNCERSSLHKSTRTQERKMKAVEVGSLLGGPLLASTKAFVCAKGLLCLPNPQYVLCRHCHYFSVWADPQH